MKIMFSLFLGLGKSVYVCVCVCVQEYLWYVFNLCSAQRFKAFGTNLNCSEVRCERCFELLQLVCLVKYKSEHESCLNFVNLQ